MRHETRHGGPSPLCYPAKGSRWEFFVALMDCIKSQALPPDWFNAGLFKMWPALEERYAEWQITLLDRELKAKQRVAQMLSATGVPAGSLVEPYSPQIQAVVDQMLFAEASVRWAASARAASSSRPRKRKISIDKTMLVGISVISRRVDGKSQNAVFEATADFLNEGLRPGSANAGLDRHAIGREFKKFKSLVDAPDGGRLMSEAISYFCRLIDLEQEAASDPRYARLRGAALIRAFGTPQKARAIFLRRFLLADPFDLFEKVS